MRFKIPQFIDVEDKLFGPLTFKQFIYLAGGGGLVYILYKALPIYIAVFPIVLTAGFVLALAFYKVNNKSFIQVLEAGFRHMLARRLFIWRKKEKPIQRAGKKVAEDAGVFVPKLSESKLKDIAWSLDVQDSIYAGEDKQK